MPDGSSFQLQHWTHEFQYAVTAGEGDWRGAGIAATSAEFSRPLHAVLTSPRRRARRTQPSLPDTGSLLRAEPADRVRIAAVKAAGNPLVRGSAAPADPRRRLAVRLVGHTGSAVAARLVSDVVALTDLSSANLLEEPGDRLEIIEVGGCDAVTVLATPAEYSTVDGGPLGAEAEPARPLFAKYWLHNRGPAPLGGLPLAVHLDPTRAEVEPGRCGAAAADRGVRLHGRRPARLRAVGACRTAGRSTSARCRSGCRRAGTCSPTCWSPRPPTRRTGGTRCARCWSRADAPGLPPSWRQPVEDVAVLTVGAPSGDLIRFAAEPEPVRVRAGARARLSVRVASAAAAPIALEAAVISPWGTWECVGPRAVGATLPAGGEVELAFEVAPPRSTPAGSWWALVRVVGAGRLLYSPAVPFEVTR